MTSGCFGPAPRPRVWTPCPASSRPRSRGHGRLFSPRGRSIGEPNQLADRPDACRRHVAVAASDRAEDCGLFFARYEERDPPAAVNRGIGQRDANLGAATPDAGPPALALVQYGFSGQQRRGVAVAADPEQGNVKQGTLRVQGGRAIGILQSPLIAPRRVFRRAVGRNWMNVLRRYRRL